MAAARRIGAAERRARLALRRHRGRVAARRWPGSWAVTVAGCRWGSAERARGDLTAKRGMRCPTLVPASAMRIGGVHHQVREHAAACAWVTRCICLSCCR